MDYKVKITVNKLSPTDVPHLVLVHDGEKYSPLLELESKTGSSSVWTSTFLAPRGTSCTFKLSVGVGINGDAAAEVTGDKGNAQYPFGKAAIGVVPGDNTVYAGPNALTLK